MSTLSYFWTDGNNKEFQSFYQKTEEYYCKIVGGLERYSDTDVEIKRVWVEPEYS